MHPAVRAATAGRVGYPINYCPGDHVMPPPPQHAKEIHDVVDLESTADPLGKRPAKWKSASGNQVHKFSREVSHMKLDNICTVETRVHDPKLRALQCWYLPKLKKDPRLPGAKVEDPPRMFQVQRPSRFFARPEMWGSWNISTEVPSPRERERMTRRTSKDNWRNTKRFYHKNEDSISALRNMHKRGDKPRKEVQTAKSYIDHLKKRKEDIEAVLNLDALTQALKFLDGWDSSSLAASSKGGCED